jgi:catechol 2,3-dioxygenase-like lactoylglutathione lyase family enzyme
MAVIATRIRSFAPQLLVDDLERAIKFYSEVLGFSFGPTWLGFYAIGERDGFEVHLKCAPKAVEDREQIGGNMNIWTSMPASLEWTHYMPPARRKARPF